MIRKLAGCVVLLILLGACDKPWNNPYPKGQTQENTLYASFAEQPRTLDPARAYSSNEYLFIAQVYEPPLQYHYLKRPYTLEPLTASEMPTAVYDPTSNTTTYTIKIKPGIRYQPHPALARDKNKQYRYLTIDEDYLEAHKIYTLSDFAYSGTRELTAEDYVYQIKRLAHPEVQSPILGLMSEYIVGLGDYAKALKQLKSPFVDLRNYPLKGVKATSRYVYKITIKGEYPQFMYWLAMPFFAPMPWEADMFDSQPGMKDHNLTLDWYPIGTGPYRLLKNNPNRVMILAKNPNFHGERYPTEGMPGDKQTGLLQDAGHALPLVDEVIFSLEKESIPRWNKFLQGYYDSSGISADSFEQAIKVDDSGSPQLTPMMQAREIRLQTSIDPSIYYMGFNMLDPIVGGDSERARKLRQAISILLDYEEFIQIFFNGRGQVANGPIPPGIFGYSDKPNPLTHVGKQRFVIDKAKTLLTQAGYPDGIDPKTGEPLVLHYDTPSGTGPDDLAKFDWLRKQFRRAGIALNIRATQYNRFQQKMRTGQAQLFTWGWNADYPDPENFLFLLYGPNGKVQHGGENAANYSNSDFDKLFERMKILPNSAQRQQLIQSMIQLLQKDAPWVWGFFPKRFVLAHDWNRENKPMAIGNNTLKYAKVNAECRYQKQREWNRAILWPIGLGGLLLIFSFLPVVRQYWVKEHQSRKSREKS